MNSDFPIKGFPSLPDDMITNLLEGAQSNVFSGMQFMGAPDFLLRMCIADDHGFNELISAIKDILKSAKDLGIYFSIVNGQVIIDDSSKISPMLMKNAEAVLPFLRIVLCRMRPKQYVEVAKTEPVVQKPKPKKKAECWCVEGGKPNNRSDTPHRCGLLKGGMGITLMVDGEIETHPVPCNHGKKCYNKTCLYSH
jgi:hypothetical protein